MHVWFMLEMTNLTTGMRSAMRPGRRFLPLRRPISGGGRFTAYQLTLSQNLCGATSATDQRHRQTMYHGIEYCTVSGTYEPGTASSPRRSGGSRKYGRWIALHAIIRQLLRTCRFIRWLYMLPLEKVLIVAL